MWVLFIEKTGEVIASPHTQLCHFRIHRLTHTLTLAWWKRPRTRISRPLSCSSSTYQAISGLAVDASLDSKLSIYPLPGYLLQRYSIRRFEANFSRGRSPCLFPAYLFQAVKVTLMRFRFWAQFIRKSVNHRVMQSHFNPYSPKMRKWLSLSR